MLSSVESFGQSMESAHPLGMSTLPVPSMPPLRRGQSDQIEFKKGRTADVASLKDELIGHSINSPDKATYRKDSNIIGGRLSGELNVADSTESIAVIKKTLASGVDGSRELDGKGSSRGRGTASNYERGLEQALNEGGEGYRRDMTGALRVNKPGGGTGACGNAFVGGASGAVPTAGVRFRASGLRSGRASESTRAVGVPPDTGVRERPPHQLACSMST